VGEFGLPSDKFAWLALATAALSVVLFARERSWSRCLAGAERHYRTTLLLLALLAALGSVAYIAYYLRGGPRIIDATAYLQQAKVFANDALTSPAFAPSAATRGRFTYFNPTSASSAILFPPGFAAVLSLGVRLGAPLLVGPVIAALLVWATAELTRRLFARNDAALVAALLSATTMVLRYHTADTMSHGLAALLLTVAIASTIGVGLPNGAAAGTSLGWLIATRPVTGMALMVTCLAYRLLKAGDRRWFWGCLLGVLPGVTLWFAYQWRSTGELWHATQYAYYTVADGPPGCFRYGFGRGIGCLFEHGDYVSKRLPHGYGLLQAAYITLLRLRWHCLDVHNFELLIIGLLVAIKANWQNTNCRLSIVALAAVVVAYLPFYFDASYPGGGARLYVDVIPLEHALVSGWLVTRPWSRWFLPISLAGFALHGSFEHGKLRDRDGGRPMFESSVLSNANVQRGLVFVATDHGFLLGHNPGSRDAQRGIVVLREHDDAHDRAAWEALGRPATYRYRFDPLARDAQPKLEIVSVESLTALSRFEAEAQWPALAVDSGWVRPVFPPNDCSSARRGLALEPVNGKASVTLALYAPHAGSYDILFGFVGRKTGRQRFTLKLGNEEHVVEQDALEHECFTKTLDGGSLVAGDQSLRIDTNALGIVVDYWRLFPR